MVSVQDFDRFGLPTPASLDLEGPLWHYAVEIYQRPGVQPALLELQDRCDVDLCLLLSMLFAGKCSGLHVDTGLTAAADQVIRDWREEVVTPLRRVRRTVRGPEEDKGNERRVYDAIKEAELLAEMWELALLAAWLDEQSASSVSRGSHDAPSDIIRAVVNFYSSDASDGRIEQAIGSIVAAIP